MATLVLGACASVPPTEEDTLLAAASKVERASREVDRALARVSDRVRDVEKAEKRMAKAEKRMADARDEFEKTQLQRDRARTERDLAEAKLRKAELRLQERQLALSESATDGGVFRLVQRTLLEDPKLRHVAVSAQVIDGVVHLRGRVPDLATRDHAVTVVGSVPGVKSVESKLDVKGESFLDWPL